MEIIYLKILNYNEKKLNLFINSNNLLYWFKLNSFYLSFLFKKSLINIPNFYRTYLSDLYNWLILLL